MLHSSISFFEQVSRNFDRAAKLTEHDPTLLAQIKECNSVYHMAFPLRRDDGTIEVIHAWRAERNVLVIPDTFLKAGGVTVSYFEWLKDLEHVRFGRTEKRFEELAFRRLLEAVESATERKLSDDMLAALAQGADERDLVYSGLEETMCHAYREIHEIRQRHDGKIDLRTASFIDAIDKIAAAYSHLGIFP